jgi:hypothetical protein
MDPGGISAALLAAVIASAMGVREFWSAGRLGFLRGSVNFYAYAFVQAVVGFLGVMCFDFLVQEKILNLPSLQSSGFIAKSVVIGFLAKWLSCASILEVEVRGEKIPIGSKWLVDTLQEKIEEDELVALMDHLSLIEPRFSSVEEVIEAIKPWQPKNKKPQQHIAFLGDLKGEPSVMVALRKCYEYAGKKVCDRAFHVT